MPIEQYAALPDELLLRDGFGCIVRQRGFRSKTVVIVTTLVDAQEIPADEIAGSSTVAAGRRNCKLEKFEGRAANGPSAV